MDYPKILGLDVFKAINLMYVDIRKVYYLSKKGKKFGFSNSLIRNLGMRVFVIIQ